MSFCEFCGKITPHDLEKRRFGKDAENRQDNWWVCDSCKLGSSNPNLQNIPIRTELGREIRKAFVPRLP